MRLFASSPREPANEVIFDIKLIEHKLPLVLSHMNARSLGDSVKQNLNKLIDLQKQRVALVQEGNAQRGIRKALSADIGKLLQKDKSADVSALKTKVEEATAVASRCETQETAITSEMQSLLLGIPNLLDDRYVVFRYPPPADISIALSDPICI
jgi:seryl-tRNA synthetase